MRNNILDKRIPRLFRKNFLKYLAILFLFTFSTIIMVGMRGGGMAEYSAYEETCNNFNVEDGEFSVYNPLSNKILNEIKEMGVDIEDITPLVININDTLKIKLFKPRQNINRVNVREGKLPTANNEVLLEYNFAIANSLNIGDNFIISNQTYEIVGLGNLPDYIMPVNEMSDLYCDALKFGIVIVNEDSYDKLSSSEDLAQDINYTYAYKLNGLVDEDQFKEYIFDLDIDSKTVNNKYMRQIIKNNEAMKNEFAVALEALARGNQDISDAIGDMTGDCGDFYTASTELANSSKELSDSFNKYIDDYMNFKYSNVNSFITRTNNSRIISILNGANTMMSLSYVIGIILFILVAYIISVFIIQDINTESKIIGTLLASGYNKQELIRHYIKIPLLLALIGEGIGLYIGLQIQLQIIAGDLETFSVGNVHRVLSTDIIVAGVILPILITFIVNVLTLNKRLSATPLNLLNDVKSNVKEHNVNIRCRNFTLLFGIKNVISEIRTTCIMIGGLFIAVFLVVFSMVLYSSISNIGVDIDKEVQYNYMYTLKYPSSTRPENAEALYVKSLASYSKYLGQDVTVNIMGIPEDTKYFNFQIPYSTKYGEIYISDVAAEKLDLKVGNDLVLSDQNSGDKYGFKIVGIVPYANGLTAFMNIDTLRELMGVEKKDATVNGKAKKEIDKYYNVLLSNETLNIELGRIAAITTKEDMIILANTFMLLNAGMMILCVLVAVVVFVITTYILLKMNIDKSKNNISLLKIFGYNNNEISRMYLDGNYMVIIINIVIGIPLAKFIINKWFPSAVANITMRTRLDVNISLYIYAIIGMITVFVLILTVLKRKVNKVQLTEVLKNRD